MSSMSSKCPILTFPLPSGREESHWGLDPMNREGVPKKLFVY
jgi:hypothetical protein